MPAETAVADYAAAFNDEASMAPISVEQVAWRLVFLVCLDEHPAKQAAKHLRQVRSIQ
jgi:hypothetical protein